jgi:hypothetical protein
LILIKEMAGRVEIAAMQYFSPNEAETTGRGFQFPAYNNPDVIRSAEKQDGASEILTMKGRGESGPRGSDL